MRFKVTGRMVLKGDGKTPVKPPMRGLGDAVAKVAEPIKRAMPKLFKNCNCEGRKKWLNEHFPFGNVPSSENGKEPREAAK